MAAVVQVVVSRAPWLVTAGPYLGLEALEPPWGPDSILLGMTNLSVFPFPPVGGAGGVPWVEHWWLAEER